MAASRNLDHIRIHEPVNDVPEFAELERKLGEKWIHDFHSYPPSQLYHYTSAEGLVGIITSQVLWHTDASALSDPGEIEYGRALIRDLTQKHASPALRTGVEVSLNPLSIKGIVPYVCCFCEVGDLLSQWRGYGKEGYSIGLHVGEDSVWRLTSNDHVTKPKLRRVLYEQSKQEMLIKTAVKEFSELLDEQLTNISSIASEYGVSEKDARHNLTKGASMGLANILTEYILSFKHRAFEQESEWRLIYTVDPRRQPKSLQFRAVGGYPVSYVEVELREAGDRDFLPISEIVISPTLDSSLAESAIKTLVDPMPNQITLRLPMARLRRS